MSPWSLARRVSGGRRGIVMLVLAALLYALGMHAARACHPVSTEQIGGVAVVQGTACHQDEPDAAQAACEAHCRNDAQSGRLSLSFDLPAAMPTGIVQALVLPLAPQVSVPELAPGRRDSGPPLHILLHRLLR